MVEVTAFTAARSQAIEDSAINSGYVNESGNLILVQHDLTEIDAGSVIGPEGPEGPQGSPGTGITICTSSTRPTGGSLFEGLYIYETDTNKCLIYDGSNWVTVSYLGSWDHYTPVVTQGTTLMGGVSNDGIYTKIGRTVSGEIHFTSISIGLRADLTCSLPFACFGSTNDHIGTAIVHRSGLRYHLGISVKPDDRDVFIMWQNYTSDPFGNNPNDYEILQINDVLTANFKYNSSS